jgi:hypothetical protein
VTRSSGTISSAKPCSTCGRGEGALQTISDRRRLLAKLSIGLESAHPRSMTAYETPDEEERNQPEPPITDLLQAAIEATACNCLAVKRI